MDLRTFHDIRFRLVTCISWISQKKKVTLEPKFAIATIKTVYLTSSTVTPVISNLWHYSHAWISREARVCTALPKHQVYRKISTRYLLWCRYWYHKHRRRWENQIWTMISGDANIKGCYGVSQTVSRTVGWGEADEGLARVRGYLQRNTHYNFRKSTRETQHILFAAQLVTYNCYFWRINRVLHEIPTSWREGEVPPVHSHPLTIPLRGFLSR